MPVTAGLTPDTTAVLLLCGRFGEVDGEFKPLTTGEYNTLARWLYEQGLRPSALIDGLDDFERFEESGLDRERVGRLLARGLAMATAVERWQNHSLWVISRADPDYPRRYLDQLKAKAPPLLYGVGDRGLLQEGGLAVVGSRDVDDAGLAFTRAVAARAAAENITIISGGARGVDQAAMLGVLETGGAAVGVLAGGLSREAVRTDYRNAIVDQRLVLMTPFSPSAGFAVGQAMGRNRLIYTLSDWTLVIDSDAERGGTKAGVEENFKHRWVPLFVRAGENISEGNRRILEKGGIPFDAGILTDTRPLTETLQELAAGAATSNGKVAAHVPPIAVPEPIDDPIFDAVWPHIARHLNEPLNPKELLERLGSPVMPKQLETWLKQAVELGLVEKLTKPVRYRLKDAPPPPEPGTLPVQRKFDL